VFITVCRWCASSRAFRACAGALVIIILAACAPDKRSFHAQFEGKSPSIRFDSSGTLHIAFVEPGRSSDRVAIRTLGHALSTTKPVSPVTDKPEAYGEVGPILALLPNGEEVVVYSSAIPGGQWSSELRMQRSHDGGASWSTPQLIHDDHRLTSHSFVDVAVNRGGDAVFSWLDDRSGHQGVRAAVLHNDSLSRNTSVDDFTCECCRTTLLTAADGALWLAYRDHAEGDVRNMAYAISRDGGASFVRQGDIADDHWSVNGCPDSGPRLTQTADGAIWATWFNGKAGSIEAAQSRGRGFSAPQVLAAPTAMFPIVNHPEIGTLPDGRLILFYEANQAKGTRTLAMRIGDSRGMTWSDPVIVATNAVGPRFTRSDDHAAFAFTRFDGSKPSVVIEDWRDLVASKESMK